MREEKKKKTVRYFEKKMGLKGNPRNYDELKEEILKWPRIGMVNDSVTGFVRGPDFSHIYPGIDDDVNRLISEGYLFEISDNNHLHDSIKKKNSTSNRKDEKVSTLLYPINIDVDKEIEVRGSKSIFP